MLVELLISVYCTRAGPEVQGDEILKFWEWKVWWIWGGKFSPGKIGLKLSPKTSPHSFAARNFDTCNSLWEHPRLTYMKQVHHKIAEHVLRQSCDPGNPLELPEPQKFRSDSKSDFRGFPQGDRKVTPKVTFLAPKKATLGVKNVTFGTKKITLRSLSGHLGGKPRESLLSQF